MKLAVDLDNGWKIKIKNYLKINRRLVYKKLNKINESRICMSQQVGRIINNSLAK